MTITGLISGENLSAISAGAVLCRAATQKKLEAWGITTIGDLASRDRQFMRRYFGKVGEMLHWFALGEDISEVALASEAIPVKSVGNSVTAVHDLHTHGEARLVLRVLAESVASRLRDQGLKGKGIALSLRDIHLFRWSLQRKRARPTQLAEEILEDAEILFAPGLAERAAAAQHRDQRI